MIQQNNRKLGRFFTKDSDPSSLSEQQLALYRATYETGCHIQLAYRFPDVVNLNDIDEDSIENICRFVGATVPTINRVWNSLVSQYQLPSHVRAAG